MDAQWRNSQLILWRKMFWALSGCHVDSPWQCNVKNLDRFHFRFPSYWSLSLLSYTYIFLPISLVLKLLYVLCTSFLAHGYFVKVVQLFKSFPMVCSMTIFGKQLPTVWGPGFEICHFSFSAVAEPVCTPTMATCIFLLLVPNDKN